ncbi:putative short chain type dehydrogenase [Biscogniauxia marginata]|nr:putative short chain type dehydrogenase [Biscogniauxia marginata]
MPTVLILGAGPNIGQATAETFAAAGFQVAVASRSPKLDPKFRHFVFDASNPETVPALFEQVSSAVGVPSVVIYNLYNAKRSDAEHPFDSELDQFQDLLNVNVTSVYITAREAVKGFEKLGAEGLGPQGGTFIFTGNLLNGTAVPGLLSFGIGKSASAHLIQHLALAAYPGKPYKFYYGDERHEDGSPMTRDLGGEAHGKKYLELAQDPKQQPWLYTFVGGKGYVEFPPKGVIIL